MVWPLEPDNILDFVDGHNEVLVIEEKRPIIEDQLIKYLLTKQTDQLLLEKMMKMVMT